jgi:poly(3-hydroxybutyrate) depolymerase
LAPAAAVAALTLLASTLSGAAAERQEPRSLTTEIRKTVTINYLLYLPTEYGQNPSARWPLILFLHGAGERGSDLSKLTAYGPPKLVAEGQDLPFIIVSPQVPARATWDIDALDAVLGEVLQKYAVDEDRVYLTGVSMGTGTGLASLACGSRWDEASEWLWARALAHETHHQTLALRHLHPGLTYRRADSDALGSIQSF